LRRGALDVLVVAGQSNALGYASYVIDPKTHKDVFTDSSRSPADHTALLIWDESGVLSSVAAPVLLDTPQRLTGSSSPIFGPEVGLARALYADGQWHVLVVKVAIDGSSLAEDWLPGQTDFKATLADVKAAETWARREGWVPSAKALYWFQGRRMRRTRAWRLRMVRTSPSS
jgi:Carbohydrate esterase, sialic acid-specific acetylesterase